MRLIPHTTHGTALLAAAVWLLAAPALWNTLAPQPRAVFPMPTPFVAGFTPDGRPLLTATRDVTNDFLEVRTLSFAPDGRFLSAAGRRTYSRAVWWATDDWHEAGHLSGGPGESVLAGATFAPDGRLAVLRDGPPLRLTRLDP